MRKSTEVETRRRHHRLLGLGRVGYACMADCSCGWSSKPMPGEERAFLAFWRHRAARWIRAAETA